MAATNWELRAVACVFGIAKQMLRADICMTVTCAEGDVRTFKGDETDVPWWDPDATELPPPRPLRARPSPARVA